jgi:HAD superfamily hydrolase (TIGR01509 family)
VEDGRVAPPRALIFDFDGLMIDTEGLYAATLLEVARGHGVVTDLAAIGHLFGSTGPDNEAAWAALLDGWDIGLDLAALEELIRARAGSGFDELPLLPGVAELLDAAPSAGWRTAIATGKARWRLDEHLARLGIGDRLDAVVTAEEVANGKPAPDIFLEAARRLEVDPTRCVVLEDSLAGCQAALAAGMVAVACPGPVTADQSFPDGCRRVTSLLDVRLDELLTQP